MKKTDIYDIIKASVAVIFALLTAFASFAGFMREIEYLAEDVVYQHPGSIPHNITIIAIDEKTLDMLGPYSDWDRSYFAELIDILCSGGTPTVIGLDVIFSGSGDTDADNALVAAAKRYGNIVTASKLETGVRLNGGIESFISDETVAYPALDAVTEHGFTTPVFDSDGYIRRFNGTVISDGREYNSFALKVAQKAGYDVPVRTVYEFSYSGTPGSFETVPMSKVLDGSVPGSYFDGRIVLVGACEEGLMDSYSVPVDHSRNMYGVEIQANMIAALTEGRLIGTLPAAVRAAVAFVLTAVLGFVILFRRLRTSLIVTAASAALYTPACLLFFWLTSLKNDILCIPAAILLLFAASLVLRYLESQRVRREEMQKMLFSMADSMAEAIEGRTPYNANHTKNVAKRCMEMLDFINELHDKKQTELHFSENDKNQLYLAAMLHDIGKMDVPTNVMDKPTRLGSKIGELRDRMCIISLKTRIDALEGRMSAETAQKECDDIKSFLDRLDSFDCGRPLKEPEIEFIDDLAGRVYHGTDGEEIPYLTQDELDDLHIRTGTLSEKEREIMKSHVVHTDRILSHVFFGKEFANVRRMAADHHELLNGKGYPLGKTAESLDTMTRILTIMDIYDSLVADDRPYKKAKPIPVAFDILDEEAEDGRVDKELLEFAKMRYLHNDNEAT